MSIAKVPCHLGCVNKVSVCCEFFVDYTTNPCHPDGRVLCRECKSDMSDDWMPAELVLSCENIY
jgi:hypothetical protein